MNQQLWGERIVCVSIGRRAGKFSSACTDLDANRPSIPGGSGMDHIGITFYSCIFCAGGGRSNRN